MRRSSLAVLYLTVFIDLLGFGIILPQLAYVAEHFGATGVWVGALMTAYSAVQFLGAPLLGRLSDRFGRRPILILSLAGSAISLTLSGLAQSLFVLIFARSMAGLFGGSIATAQAYIADVTLPKDRARYMGLLGASIGLGFVFGPALGAAMSRYGFGASAFVAAGLAAANCAFAFVTLVESRPVTGEARSAHGHLNLADLARALTHPLTGRVVGATFLSTFGFVSMEATFALLGERRFGLDSTKLGLVFAYIGVLIVLVQGGLVGRLTARYGERALAMVGALTMSVALAALPHAGGLGLAMGILGAVSVGQALVTPTLTALLSRAANADEQGATLGVGQSAAAAARAAGPLLAGSLFDRAVALPYSVAAALLLGAAALVGLSRRAALAAERAGASPSPARAVEP
jgi:DHA1 family tetracycline resistance protein-like MFS transporter